MFSYLNKRKGFTLIELLVVVAIIGLLSSVVLASLDSSRAKGRDARRMSDMKAMQTAIELAKTSGFSLPLTYSTMNSALSGLVPTYIKSMPIDPNPNVLVGTTYYYCNNVLQGIGNYCHNNDTNVNTYAIPFFTEKKIGSCPGKIGTSWQASMCCLTSEGIFPAETGNVAGLHCRER